MVTLIRPDFVQSLNLTDTVDITCIHSETKDYPTTLLHLQTTKRQHTGPVGVVPYLPVLVLLGRDFTMFCQLWTSMSGDMGNQKGGGSRRSGRDARRRNAWMCGFQEVDTSTQTLSEVDSGEARLEEGEASLDDM